MERKYPHLMEPGKICGLKVRNRIVMPAMGSGLGEMGYPGGRIIEYYRRRAAGGAGLLIIEASYVVPVPGVRAGHLSLASDTHLGAWKRLVAAIHRGGAAAGVQLIHPGKQISKALTGDLPAVAPSSIPSPAVGIVPHALSIAETEEIIQAFAAAAGRAAAAGADLVEVHGAHGYLGSSFLSPHTNKRTDKYGGTQKERARFLMEVIQAIKHELGRDFPVSCRINGSDLVDGGMTMADAREATQALFESGADVLNVTAGVYGSYPSIIPPGIEPQGCFVHLAENIKHAVPIPVITVGRIKRPELAEKIIADNKADFVAVGRGQIADPEWVRKAFSGQEAAIVPCIGCLQGCIDSVNSGRAEGLTCMVNPHAGREYNVVFNQVGKPGRAVVVGGGPAGLNAAWAAAHRGYQVVLIEEQPELGGQLNLAAMIPGKTEFKEAIDYFSRKVRSAGVEIILGKRADIESLRTLHPAKVILAAGAEPLVPRINGIETADVIQAWDVLKQGGIDGQKVAIIGGGAVGIETAEYLARLGKAVTVIEMLPYWGNGMSPVWRWYLKNQREKKELDLTILVSVKVIRAEGNKLVVEHRGNMAVLEGFDRIVLAAGARPNDSMREGIERLLQIPVITAGDARVVRNALAAVADGFNAGLTI